jgi:prepilin-type processing-associated H-X9-DG protein
MKQIGLAAIMWANDHNGQFPPDLDAILKQQELPPAVFVCPTSPDAPATGATMQQTLADFHQPGHLSYVYIGKDLTVKSPTDAVVLYERPANHGGGDMSVTSEFKAGPKSEGMNVLCADGHVKFLDTTEAQVVLKQVANGTWPIHYPLPVAPATTQANFER